MWSSPSYSQRWESRLVAPTLAVSTPPTLETAGRPTLDDRRIPSARNCGQPVASATNENGLGGRTLSGLLLALLLFALVAMRLITRVWQGIEKCVTAEVSDGRAMFV
jgi:hypothetical protein